MNTRIGLVFGIISVVRAILLFAVGPIIATHQASACGYGGCGGYTYGGNGFYVDSGNGFYVYGGIGYYNYW
jgi:hypothetical protein